MREHNWGQRKNTEMQKTGRGTKTVAQSRKQKLLISRKNEDRGGGGEEKKLLYTKPLLESLLINHPIFIPSMHNEELPPPLISSKLGLHFFHRLQQLLEVVRFDLRCEELDASIRLKLGYLQAFAQMQLVLDVLFQCHVEEYLAEIRTDEDT